MNVKDNLCVVTGGAGGIGLVLCSRFAREGEHVVLSDLNQEACERQAMPIGVLAEGTQRWPLGRDQENGGS